MNSQYIKIRGARQHNLKNVSIDIPKNNLVIFTGVSGSGKSSMAFDTIYAEGQRRYVESLSSYARQFLGILEKPDVDFIEGLSPAISIDQKTISHNPRSTVGTSTEIYDYLRLLYARVGHPHCPVCGSEIKKQSLEEIVNSVIELIKNILKSKKILRILINSPIINDKKGEFSNLFLNLKSKGFSQVIVDGFVYDTDNDFYLIKTNKHTISAIVDKISIEHKLFKDPVYLSNIKNRLSDSINQSLELSDGLVQVSEILDNSFEIPKYPKKMENHIFSERFACPIDNIQIPEIEPRSFSFNSPHGACVKCSGLGKILMIEKRLLFSLDLTILEGGILPFSSMFEKDTWYSRIIKVFCQENNIDMNIPIKNIENEKLNILLYGTGDKQYKVFGKNRFGNDTLIIESYSGIIAELERRYKDTKSDWVRYEIEKYMTSVTCPDCKGARLKPSSLSVTIQKYSISALTDLSVEIIFKIISELRSEKSSLTVKEREIAKLILLEIEKRLEFLISVGLSYLTLSRPSGSLSGGEAQRIRLASQIGSGLSGVLYVLDEPTIGLHQKDNQMLINTLKKLRNLGNTVIVVEHDEAMMKNADYIFDFGPGAGKNGGEIVSEGSFEKICKDPKSITGMYLSKKKTVAIYKNIQNSLIPDEINSKNGFIKINGCKLYNLKNIDVIFPLNKLVVITGVSGSGKSTLLVESLYPSLFDKLNRRNRNLTNIYSNIEGWENADKVILVDQTPIGKTPRSNPATYTKLFDEIRETFSQSHDAKIKGLKKGAFSFNVKGGRCEACEGQGQIKIEMQFMSDIWVKCEVCQGKRYNFQTLDVYLRGKNIYDILRMTVDEAIEYFHNDFRILKKLETLSSVGLGYMELGQSATTLSGGEAQRVKLSSELGKKETGNTIYILDEPTTGLHFADIENLLNVLKKLVEKGNSVFVIEHNMDVIKNADWIIDLGPEGGENGGYIVAEGSIKNLIKYKRSYTSEYLKKIL